MPTLHDWWMTRRADSLKYSPSAQTHKLKPFPPEMYLRGFEDELRGTSSQQ